MPRANNPKPGKDALAAYQLRLAEAKKKEHETVVNSILVDPDKLERQRKMMGEVDQSYFASTKVGGGVDVKSGHDSGMGDVTDVIGVVDGSDVSEISDDEVDGYVFVCVDDYKGLRDGGVEAY